MTAFLRTACPVCAAGLTVTMVGLAVDSVTGCVHARWLAHRRAFQASMLRVVRGVEKWQDEDACEQVGER